MWSDDDQDLALAWMAAQREVCSHCGSRDADWLEDVTLADGRVVQRPMADPPLVADVSECVGCEVVAERRKRLPKSKRDLTKVFLRQVREGEFEDDDGLAKGDWM